MYRNLSKGKNNNKVRQLFLIRYYASIDGKLSKTLKGEQKYDHKR